MVLIFIYISLIEERSKLNPVKEEGGNNDENWEEICQDNIDGSSIVKLEPGERYSVLKAFFRLSFAIYMSNYLFIRTDFFTERNIFYNSLYVYVSTIYI